MFDLKKRVLAGILTVASVVSVTACNSNASTNSGNNNSQQSQTSSNASPATTIDDEKDNPVDVSSLELDVIDKEEIEPVTLKWLGCYDITTAGDIKPAYKYFKENYECEIQPVIIGSLQIQEKLTTAIASDESPDLVDYADNTFPLLMSSNMYTPLNDYIDLNAPQWAGLEDYINKYKWNGKNYYYPWSYNASPFFLIYNRGLFSRYGIDDPKELYDKGEWDWNAFESCMKKFIQQGDEANPKTGLYGHLAGALFDTTGVPLISVDNDGKIIQNFKDANITRAAEFLQQLKKDGISKFPEGYINVDEAPIVDGLSAFQSMGEWIITNYAKKMVKDDSLDIFFVPYPKDPNADEYYYGMSTFGYLVPAGSKNTKQASVFINCCRLSITDEELAAVTKDSIMRNKKYTDEMYDFMYEFHSADDKFHCVVDEPYGLDEATTALITEMLTMVAFPADDVANEKSWTQMKEANIGAIEKQVDYYNSLLTNN